MHIVQPGIASTFITGVFQAFLGIFRLGIIVDFLSHSTIIGFMRGTAVIIGLQQLKGVFGLKHFTKRTDVVSVLRSVFNQIHEVGPLNKGLSPISAQYLNFNPKYLPTPIKFGVITGILALAFHISIGRNSYWIFAMLKNDDHIDVNKEMIAFGLMNIVGSFTSCYLTTGPFSKSAVHHNAGCKTAMSNIVMSIFMMLTLLFLAPLFSYTPLVSLSAIIITAMLGLIEYEEAYRLFKVDKFDFCISVSAFIGVAFLSMDICLMISIGLSILRALLYVARPAVSNIKRIPNSKLFRDVEQYPLATGVQGIVILKLGSSIYFANAPYVKERC